jgi:hypothetical protein
MISIDMPAGPSEVLVIADRYASPVHIAADLLSQVLSPFPLSYIYIYIYIYSCYVGGTYISSAYNPPSLMKSTL